MNILLSAARVGLLYNLMLPIYFPISVLGTSSSSFQHHTGTRMDGGGGQFPGIKEKGEESL